MSPADWSDYDPTLPYPEPGGEGTAGWSGSDTSHERAVSERDSGTVALRQRETLASLGEAGIRGLTWRELGDERGWHHGQSSSVLSVLHKADRIVRLVERRHRCHVYVLPEWVDGRDTQSRRSRNVNERGAQVEAERKLAAIRALCEEYALLDPSDVLEILDGTEQEE